MAVTKAQADVGAGSGGSTSITPTLAAGATAGNLLTSALSIDTGTVTGLTQPSGWSMIQFESSGEITGGLAFKVAVGGETAAGWSWTGTRANHAVISEWQDSGSGTFALDVSNENTSNMGTVVTSQTSGSATSTVATAFAVSMFAIDTGADAQTGHAFTNSFTETYDYTSSTRPGLVVAVKDLTATGAQETTFSTTDTGAEMYGAIAVFSITSGGGGFQPAWAYNVNKLIGGM